ncbi:hypothetical protein ONE63_002857 [Megalurothrips usitatus]|uniref:Copine-3 n=1 Tax=Megalurothrips usitatus TaxID=439358 RepID=A0AAV7X900_9NEOP|nr:hypothetical protein ONE63_002857 [Megalurothrips usitatus]
MSTFVPGTAAQPTSEVEVTVSCRSLRGKDLLSKSDPLCVAYIQPFGQNRWVEIYRSEVINNNHDPDFAKKLQLPYRFEEQQNLKFGIYDVDSDSSDLRDHDYLGAATCSLGQIISNGKVKLPLLKHESSTHSERGFIILMAEELAALKDEAVIQFSGHKLDKKDFFGKSDPFLVISKSQESGDYSIVHKTEVIKCTLNPKWAKFTIPVRTLCNGDYDRNLKISCYDWNASGNHSFIGEFFATLKELSRPGVANSFPCINEEKKKRKGDAYSNSGTIKVDFVEIRKIHSFMDYIKGGVQLHCSIAIDFTGSNGDPSTPESLHYVSNVPNSYELAIRSVGNIIQDYDSDKQFPVLGFGARLPPDGRVSHEFFVNMHPENPYCFGVEGVLGAYHNCIRQVQLYGPTNFAPVINHVAKFASVYKDGSNYFILLILTDGVITDMPQTVQAIVSASFLPMSIIIVGIGNADFSAMETLDADTVALQSGKQRAARDIVQFVPFNKFTSSGDPQTARLRLAREVLAEIPTQFLGFMKSHSISPPPLTNKGEVLLPPDPEALMLQ